MGASLNTGGRPGGGRRNRAKRHTPMHEINVTPFVDVMLVLLIIFMVAAPLLVSGLPVDLPQISAQPLSSSKTPLAVTVDDQGRIYLADQQEPIELTELGAKLKAIKKGTDDDPILLRGDKSVAYGRVADVIKAVVEGGYKKLTFVSGQEEIKKGPKS